MKTLTPSSAHYLARDAARDVIKSTFDQHGLAMEMMKPYLQHKGDSAEAKVFSLQEWDVAPDWMDQVSPDAEETSPPSPTLNARMKTFLEAAKRVFAIGKMRKQILLLFLHLQKEGEDVAKQEGIVQKLLILLKASSYEWSQAKSEFNPSDSRQKTRAKARVTHQLLQEVKGLKKAA